jgi:hypothetical protein
MLSEGSSELVCLQLETLVARMVCLEVAVKFEHGGAELFLPSIFHV